MLWNRIMPLCIIGTLAFVLGAAAPGLPPPVPQLQALDLTAPPQTLPGVCGKPQATGMVVEFVLAEHPYLLLLFQATPDTELLQFILVDRAEGLETPVWVGLVGQDGVLQVRGQWSFQAQQTRYPTPCDYFQRREA